MVIMKDMTLKSAGTIASLPDPCACFTLASCGPDKFSHVRDAWYRSSIFCMGEDSCTSQAVTEGSESKLLVAAL